jgi:leader peptidase (prepilin peptidase)/N-methyltransferase
VDLLFAAAFFVFGLAFGSFLNVCIHRMPRRILARDELDDLESQVSAYPALQDTHGPRIRELRGQIQGLSVSSGRSFCPHCGNQIAWYDNIPLASWLLLRGRCRRCSAPIAPRYFLVELMVGLLFLVCYARFGLSFATAKLCVLSFLLTGLIFTDAEHKLLPDALTLPGIGLGLAFSLVEPVHDFAIGFLSLFVGYMPAPASLPGGWRLFSLGESVLGAIVGSAFIYGIGVMYLRARGVEGMGMGDVKLMAMVGSFLGVALTVFTLFAASLMASIFGVTLVLMVWMQRTRRRMVRRREAAATARRRALRSALVVYQRLPIPFGVFLGGVALLLAFFGNALIRWYWYRFL